MGRDQFKADATTELDELAKPFDSTGHPSITRGVFCKARKKTIDRVAIKDDCDVILTPGHADAIERVAAPLRGEQNFDRLLSFVGDLLSTTDAWVTLFYTSDASDWLPGEEILVSATDSLSWVLPPTGTSRSAFSSPCG